MMPQTRGGAGAALLLCIFLFVPFSASGQPQPEKCALALRSFAVETVQGGKVRVDSGITVSNSRGMRALLRDGAVMNLSCKLMVERLRSLLANETLADVTQIYQIRHDLLTREFIMSHAGTPSQRGRKLDDLLASTWEVLSFDVPLSAPLVTGETYRVRLDVTLQHAEVPPWLEKALFFWSWDVAPPLSFTQEFVY